MHAEHLSVNDCGQCKEVEDLAARLPDAGVSVFLLTFFVEAVHLSDLAGFVVSANKCDSVRVSESRLAYQCRRRGRESYLAFKHIRRVNVSSEKYPLSTKSPRKIKFWFPFA